jgi:hypothetical protein
MHGTVVVQAASSGGGGSKSPSGSSGSSSSGGQTAGSSSTKKSGPGLPATGLDAALVASLGFVLFCFGRLVYFEAAREH